MVNTDQDQVEDCIDLAFQYFYDFHHDGTEKVYLSHQLTATDMTNKWVPVSDAIIGVTRIFPFSGTSSMNMFDIRYQFRLNDLYDFANTTLTYYVITQQHLRMIEMLLTGETPVRFNRHTDKLYIDTDWGTAVKEGDWIVMEAYKVVNPDEYPDAYNDRLLKQLATAYIKRVWGNNLKKFGGMQLPGGLVLNGQQIYDEAMQEIAFIEQRIRSESELPVSLIIG